MINGKERLENILSRCHYVDRLSKHRLEKLRAEWGGEGGEGVKGFPYGFWAFSRQPLAQSLSKIPESEEQIAIQVFQIVLTYAGLGQNGMS